MRRAVVALTMAAFVSGCMATKQVKPWQKATLAQPTMSLGGLPYDNGLYNHIYTSKEAAKGGGSISGGGCGCN